MQIKTRAVVDTGILISAFAFGGTPRKALVKAINNTQICISPAVLNEYKNVPIRLYNSNKITSLQFNALISGIAAFVADAKIFVPAVKIEICRDPEDNMLLDCCKASQAEYLITGDKDLLEINNLPFKLNIITPRQFLSV